MAKRKKNKKGNALTSAALAAFAGDFLANMLGEIIGNQFQPGNDKQKGGKIGKGSKGRNGEDVSAIILATLAENGPQSIPDLVAATGVGLSPVLHALKDVRDFRLVEFVGDDDNVQLTATGNRTAGVLRKNGIREHAGRLLKK